MFFAWVFVAWWSDLSDDSGGCYFNQLKLNVQFAWRAVNTVVGKPLDRLMPSSWADTLPADEHNTFLNTLFRGIRPRKTGATRIVPCCLLLSWANDSTLSLLLLPQRVRRKAWRWVICLARALGPSRLGKCARYLESSLGGGEFLPSGYKTVRLAWYTVCIITYSQYMFRAIQSFEAPDFRRGWINCDQPRFFRSFPAAIGWRVYKQCLIPLRTAAPTGK